MHKKSLGQEGKCLESYESITLRLAEDDNAFLCDIHRPYKLDIIMIKNILPLTYVTHRILCVIILKKNGSSSI